MGKKKRNQIPGNIEYTPYEPKPFPEPYPTPEPMTDAEWRRVARIAICLRKLA